MLEDQDVVSPEAEGFENRTTTCYISADISTYPQTRTHTNRTRFAVQREGEGREIIRGPELHRDRDINR